MNKAFALVVLACLSLCAFGETTDKNYTPVALDLAVPESPAAAALSGNFETTLKPSTAREFTSSLLALRDKKGGFAPGVSLEVTPSFFTSRDFLPDNYRSSPLTRMMLNTQISLATGDRDETKGRVQKVAAGIRIPLYDEGDVRWDPNGIFGKCAKAHIKPPTLPTPPIGPPGESAHPLDAEELKAIEVCKKAFRHASWNAQSLVFGAGQVWADNATTDEKLQSGARYFWLSYGRPFGAWVRSESKETNKVTDIQSRPGQIILQLRRIQQALKDGTEPEAERRYDSNAGALRVRYGSEDFNLSLAGSAERRSYDIGKRENVRVITGGIERRMATDWWLRITLGNERRGSTTDSPFVFFNLAWSKENEPSYATPPYKP